MDKLVILGSEDAIPDMEHDTSHMLAITEKRGVLIDCSGSTFQKLAELNISYESISDVIITHYHPDHASGLPMLLMDMWLSGRSQELVIHGLEITINKAQAMMGLYEWESWPGMYPVNFNILPNENMYPLISEADLEIYASPGKHVIPSIGLLMKFINSSQSIVYSSDTEPCDSIITLAKGADVLIHEAAGEVKGHSSGYQAAEIAAKASVKNLYLIHYKREEEALNQMIIEGEKVFDGPINLATDYMEFLLS